MEPFSYELRVSSRARRLTIRILSGGRVEVVLPKKLAEQHAHAFVKKRRKWVEKHLAIQKNRMQTQPRYAFVSGERIPFLGSELTLAITEKNTKTIAYRYGDTLFVACDAIVPKDIRAAIHSWFKKQAALFFHREALFLADKLRVDVGRITVRNQKSLWGSCSHRKNLNFNWRLLLAPPQVAHYLVAHECAHLIHRNHSEKFWELVEKICPQYEEHDQWLRQNGHLLSI